MVFSDSARRTIEAFARQLKIEARPASDGSYSFAFDRSGDLTFTPARAGERTVVSLARRPLAMNETVERQALQLAGPDPTTGRFLHAGTTRDGSVVFAVSIGDNEFDLPILDTCLQRLLQAQSAL